MATYKYTFQNFDHTNMARAVGRDLPISTKHCVEICKYIKGRKVSDARNILIGTIEKDTAIPFTRFNGGVGHKRGSGMASGRYPVKAATKILEILDSAVANAKQKGLVENSLRVESMNAHKGSTPYKHGRLRGRTVKKSHVEVVIGESKIEARIVKFKSQMRERKRRNTRRD